MIYVFAICSTAYKNRFFLYIIQQNFINAQVARIIFLNVMGKFSIKTIWFFSKNNLN